MIKAHTSKAFSLLKLELLKLLRAGVYAFAGAVCSYALVRLEAVDLGAYQGFVAAGISTLVYLGKLFVTKSEYLIKQ